MNMTKMIRVVLALMLTALTQHAAAQRPEPPPIEDRRYEDYFTFKYGKSFTKDPWTWGYTKEFAERFRMPEQWIEPQMKGVLAVAFRVSDVGQSATCGLGGREDSCWKSVNCRFDIYYDNSINLPWVKEAEIRDSFLTIQISSAGFTHDAYGRLKERYKTERGGPKPLRLGFTSMERKGWHFPTAFTYYDREYAPGVGLIGIYEGACEVPFRKGDYWLGVFANQEAQGKSKDLPRHQLKGLGLVHEAELPESFMQRAEAARQRDTQNQEHIKDRLIREFQQRQQGNTQSK